SLDHLVGALLEQRWHVEAERLRGFHVDDQFELDRELDGKITRLLAFEDSIDVSRGAPIIVTDVVAVTQQPARSREGEHGKDGWKLVTRRKRCDFLVIGALETIGHRD